MRTNVIIDDLTGTLDAVIYNKFDSQQNSLNQQFINNYVKCLVNFKEYKDQLYFIDSGWLTISYNSLKGYA